MKYKNPSLSVQERVNDLLPRMTLEEKIAQCIQIYIPPDHPGEIVDRIRAVGLGSRILGAVSLAGNVSQRTAGIEDLNEIQRIAMNEFRLGIPVIHGLDVIHGLRVIFPIPLGLAATFDPDAIQKTYNIAAEGSRQGFTEFCSDVGYCSRSTLGATWIYESIPGSKNGCGCHKGLPGRTG